MRAVLVAEDEHLTRWSVAETLREENYEVDEVSTGEKAIDLIKAKTFDAVISDYHMPGTVNGLDVLRYYHRLAPGKMKVLITTKEDTQSELQAIDGVLLSKPFLLEDLVGIINKRGDNQSAGFVNRSL
jgi:DNA-binding NtrC family response regulator